MKLKRFSPILAVGLIVALVFVLIPASIDINLGGFLPGNVTKDGFLSVGSNVALAVNNPPGGESTSLGTPAYQECIPEGVGSETGLQVFPPKLQDAGNKDNWLSTSHLHKDVHVGTPIEDIDGDTIAWDANTGNIYIDSVTDELIITAGTLSDKCKYDIKINDYVTYGGETIWVEEKEKSIVSELRARFRDYVYGSGSDLYQLEDTPQRQEELAEGWGRTIEAVRVYAYVVGTKDKSTASTRILTYGKKYNGDVVSLASEEQRIETEYFVNPETEEKWLWQEIDDLEAGVILKDGECSFVFVRVELVVHSQTFYPITPTEITVGVADDWTPMNASTLIAEGATGVILHIVANTATGYYIGLRKNGSTDDRMGYMYGNTHFWATIGVDEDRIFQAYTGTTTAVDFYVVGYTTSGVTFKTNANDKSLGDLEVEGWYGIDCSSEAPSAIGLMWEIYCVTTSREFGLRKNGSSDDRHIDTRGYSSFGAIIGCDASQICEGYIETTQVDFFLVGYITEGATFNTNATDVSLGTTGDWLDLSALPSGANMGFIEVIALVVGYGLRKNDSLEDIYTNAWAHPWGIVECDASQIIEGKIASTSVDFFVVGYATVPPVSNTPTSKDFGIVELDTSVWSNDSAPEWPLGDDECYFTVTNNGGTCSITIEATNFTGTGTDWTLGVPAANVARLKAGKSGDANEEAMVSLTNDPQAFISGLAGSGTKKWEVKLDMPTSADRYLKTTIITLVVTLD